MLRLISERPPTESAASRLAAQVEFQLPAILMVLVLNIGEDFLFLQPDARDAVPSRLDALVAID